LVQGFFLTKYYPETLFHFMTQQSYNHVIQEFLQEFIQKARVEIFGSIIPKTIASGITDTLI